jgi:hypothetical protein
MTNDNDRTAARDLAIQTWVIQASIDGSPADLDGWSAQTYYDGAAEAVCWTHPALPSWSLFATPNWDRRPRAWEGGDYLSLHMVKDNGSTHPRFSTDASVMRGWGDDEATVGSRYLDVMRGIFADVLADYAAWQKEQGEIGDDDE